MAGTDTHHWESRAEEAGTGTGTEVAEVEVLEVVVNVVLEAVVGSDVKLVVVSQENARPPQAAQQPPAALR